MTPPRPDSHHLPVEPEPDAASDIASEARRALQSALWECKRVVVGQGTMLERVLMALLTGGHVLLEGVPGLAKTLTVRTLATFSTSSGSATPSPSTVTRTSPIRMPAR